MPVAFSIPLVAMSQPVTRAPGADCNQRELAGTAAAGGLSRTRLAERFRQFLGETPMAYLAQWRLKPGAEMLQSTENGIAGVAAVGYGSEAGRRRISAAAGMRGGRAL